MATFDNEYPLVLNQQGSFGPDSRSLFLGPQRSDHTHAHPGLYMHSNRSVYSRHRSIGGYSTFSHFNRLNMMEASMRLKDPLYGLCGDLQVGAMSSFGVAAQQQHQTDFS